MKSRAACLGIPKASYTAYFRAISVRRGKGNAAAAGRGNGSLATVKRKVTVLSLHSHEGEAYTTCFCRKATLGRLTATVAL